MYFDIQSLSKSLGSIGSNESKANRVLGSFAGKTVKHESCVNPKLRSDRFNQVLLVEATLNAKVRKLPKTGAAAESAKQIQAALKQDLSLFKGEIIRGAFDDFKNYRISYEKLHSLINSVEPPLGEISPSTYRMLKKNPVPMRVSTRNLSRAHQIGSEKSAKNSSIEMRSQIREVAFVVLSGQGTLPLEAALKSALSQIEVSCSEKKVPLPSLEELKELCPGVPWTGDTKGMSDQERTMYQHYISSQFAAAVEERLPADIN